MGRLRLSKRAILALENGSIFRGLAFGHHSEAVGEVIFNTSITGYQEIVTDPSYAKQIITLTHPQIGNVGTNSVDVEADVAHATALVVKCLPQRLSNWRAEWSLDEFLKRWNVVGIHGIDTRRLTRMLRTEGALNGCVVHGDDADLEMQALTKAKQFSGLKGMDLAKVVSTDKAYPWDRGTAHIFDAQSNTDSNRPVLNVVAYDFGIKHNILRMLVDRGCSVTVVPAQTPLDSINVSVDGFFLSNGPGDPEPCGYAIETIREMLTRHIPNFGICLGHQLLGLAAGARTGK